jgi:polyphosphate kinase 2 (PPK2 family)
MIVWFRDQKPRRIGKDGVIRHVFSGMNPQGTFVNGFKQPSTRTSS